jgi:myosin heavy subunit
LKYKEKLGIISPSRFLYLSKSDCYEVDDIDDSEDFKQVLSAMKEVNISEENQMNICRIIAGILHLGNVTFKSDANHYATPENFDSK